MTMTHSFPRKSKNPVILGLAVAGMLASCSALVTRPVQEMSDTLAAIRAAREVQADVLAPELYRQANEWLFKARQSYKIKEFQSAFDSAARSRKLAEEAEYEALLSGGNRQQAPGGDPLNGTSMSSDQSQAASASTGGSGRGAVRGVGGGVAHAKPYDYPGPEATPAEAYQERKAGEEQAAAAAQQAQAQAAAQGGVQQPAAAAAPSSSSSGSGNQFTLIPQKSK